MKVVSANNHGECPRCGSNVITWSALLDLDLPTPGELTVCVGCAAFLRFSETLLLVEAEEVDLLRFSNGSPEQYSDLVKTQETVERHCEIIEKLKTKRRQNGRMKLQKLVEMADEAIARWADTTKIKPPGNPSIKVCSKSPSCDLFPNLTGEVLGRNSEGLYVLRFDAQDVKQVVTYIISEFTIDGQQSITKPEKLGS